MTLQKVWVKPSGSQVQLEKQLSVLESELGIRTSALGACRVDTLSCGHSAHRAQLLLHTETRLFRAGPGNKGFKQSSGPKPDQAELVQKQWVGRDSIEVGDEPRGK